MDLLQIREAVAKLMGRKPLHYWCPECKLNIPRHDPSVSSGGYHMPDQGCGAGLESHLPHYESDLNACAEMEATLSNDEYMAFVAYVHQISSDRARNAGQHYTRHVSAPADIRCEAFLQVKDNPQPGREEI